MVTGAGLHEFAGGRKELEQVQELASGAGAGRRGLDQGVSCSTGGGVAGGWQELASGAIWYR